MDFLVVIGCQGCLSASLGNFNWVNAPHTCDRLISSLKSFYDFLHDRALRVFSSHSHNVNRFADDHVSFFFIVFAIQTTHEGTPCILPTG